MGMLAMAGAKNAAEIAVLEAQAEDIKADTANKPKQGANIEANTASLTQGIEESKAKQALTEWQAAVAKVDAMLAEKLSGTRFEMAIVEFEKLTAEAEIAINESDISAETKEAKITTIKETAVSVQLENDLKRANIDKTHAEIDKISAEITKWAQELQVS